MFVFGTESDQIRSLSHGPCDDVLRSVEDLMQKYHEMSRLSQKWLQVTSGSG